MIRLGPVFDQQVAQVGFPRERGEVQRAVVVLVRSSVHVRALNTNREIE
jgi:hypothetical protein